MFQDCSIGTYCIFGLQFGTNFLYWQESWLGIDVSYSGHQKEPCRVPLTGENEIKGLPITRNMKSLNSNRCQTIHTSFSGMSNVNKLQGRPPFHLQSIAHSPKRRHNTSHLQLRQRGDAMGMDLNYWKHKSFQIALIIGNHVNFSRSGSWMGQGTRHFQSMNSPCSLRHVRFTTMMWPCVAITNQWQQRQ